MEIACESRIAHVAVYARGAVVTRVVTVPRPLPTGLVDLVVPGVTGLSSAGSARARAPLPREVLTLRMRLVLPSEPPAPGVLLERVRALEHDRERLGAERSQLQAQSGAVASLSLDATLASRWRPVDPAARIEDALAASSMATEVAARADARILDLDEAIEQNARDYQAACLAAAQSGGATSATRSGTGLPTREIVARIGPGDAEALSLFEVSYVVGAARWWPAYAVRLADAGRRAAWTLEAFVAQASGEDWKGAALSFCSASLVRDVRLPELRSLRLGRAQPAAPRRGYRAAPAGLEELFAPYDVAARGAAPPPPAPPPPPPTPPPTIEPARDVDFAFDEGGVGAPQAQSFARQEASTLAASPPAAGSMMRPRVGEGRTIGGRAGAPAAPAPGAAATRASMPFSAKAMSTALGHGYGGAAMQREDDTSPGFDGVPPAEVEPAEAWLEFDALTMASVDDAARRGRLVLGDGSPREGAGLGGAQTRATVAIERLSPAMTTDPHDPNPESFDVRYEGKVTADVPSNARPHRVSIESAEGPAVPRLVTVPRESADAYRETVAENPFGVALLAGPADVFVNGALLTTTPLAATGPGGKVVIGLGVEPRVRVARNARVEEGTGGLLGGTSNVDHVVTVDVTSSLGHGVAIELFERVPVTDDKDVSVELRTAQPPPTRYDQADRGKPVRGGLRWTLELAPGARQKVEYSYRVTLPARSEIMGGNRRE